MKNILRITIATLLFSPALASAQATGLQRQGIFDCNQNGAYAMNVGALGARDSVYVPVSDAAVTLNTGILVYKECVLREVVNRMREKAMADLTKRTVTSIQTGREGNAQYVEREGQELVTNMSDPTFLSVLKGETLQALNPALRTPITQAMVRSYDTQTRAPQSTLTCRYKGDLRAYQNGKVVFSIADFLVASAPQCDPVTALFLTQDIADARIARCEMYMRDQWNWGRGYYPKIDDPKNPCYAKTLTPAVTVQESFQTILDSPVRMQESADDIGQMINALYAGMTAQVMARDQGGLAGLTQSVGGQQPYINKIVEQATQGLRESVVNTALQALQVAQQVEVEYFRIVSEMGKALTTAILQLREAERQCWELVIYKNDGKPERHVCAGPVSADNTCTSTAGPCTTDPTTGVQTCPTGSPLKISTSTSLFAQTIISAEIAPKATSTVARIKASQNALDIIAKFITDITGASLNAQQLAITQFNNLVASPQHPIHNKPDIERVGKELESVQAVFLDENTGLVAVTIKGTDGKGGWTNSPSVRPGWCNVNNPDVLEAWKKCWDKNNPDKTKCPTP